MIYSLEEKILTYVILMLVLKEGLSGGVLGALSDPSYLKQNRIGSRKNEYRKSVYRQPTAKGEDSGPREGEGEG